MDKKQKEQVKKDFLRTKKRIVVSGGDWKMPLNKYLAQEKHSRKIPPMDTSLLFGQRKEYQETPQDMGILSPECVFDTKIWYLRDARNRNVSFRNRRKRI